MTSLEDPWLIGQAATLNDLESLRERASGLDAEYFFKPMPWGQGKMLSQPLFEKASLVGREVQDPKSLQELHATDRMCVWMIEQAIFQKKNNLLALPIFDGAHNTMSRMMGLSCVQSITLLMDHGVWPCEPENLGLGMTAQGRLYSVGNLVDYTWESLAKYQLRDRARLVVGAGLRALVAREAILDMELPSSATPAA